MESQGNDGTNGSDWRGYLTEDLKADPVVSGWAEKASEKDIPSIIKGYAHSQKRMGNAINLPAKDAKPEEVQSLKQKLYEAGVFKAPPKSPQDYGIKRPEQLPTGVEWSDELSERLATTLHKHGVPTEAVQDLLALHLETLGTQAKLSKATAEEGMAALKAEFGDKFDEHMELAGRMKKSIFKTDEELALFEQLGLGNDPRFMGPMLRLSKLAAQDSSYIESLGSSSSGGGTGDAARAELEKVLHDKTHPHYAGIHGPQNSKAYKEADAYLQGLYEKAYPKQGAAV